jgi:hypothetical protein
MITQPHVQIEPAVSVQIAGPDQSAILVEQPVGPNVQALPQTIGLKPEF